MFRTILTVAAYALLVGPAGAASLQVAPTTIELPKAGGSAVLYVTNNGSTPIGVHIEGFAWSEVDGADALTPTSALRLSPPMAQLAPGQRQTIRVRAKPHHAGQEQAFRLIASELPDPTDQPHNGVRFLFQFSVPVFVNESGTGDTKHPHLEWKLSRGAEGPMLSVHNTGSAHVKLSSLKLEPSSRVPIDLSRGGIVYILAGASRHWSLPAADVAPGQSYRVEAHDDRNHRALLVPLVQAQ